MRVCIRNSDNRIIEAQSGTGDLATLAQNARNAGLLDGQFTVSVMDDTAFATALKAQTLADQQSTPTFIRDQSFTSDTDRQDLLSRLETATPAQIKSYVQANITDLPSAKLLLAKILLVLGTMANQ